MAASIAEEPTSEVTTPVTDLLEAATVVIDPTAVLKAQISLDDEEEKKRVSESRRESAEDYDEDYDEEKPIDKSPGKTLIKLGD